MFKHKKKNVGTEFVVLGSFAAVVIVGFFYAAVSIILAAYPETVSQGPLAVQPVAPTAEQYKAQVRDDLHPFFSQAATMKAGDIDSAGPVFRELVVKTQDMLLRLRVPKEYRDNHLSFVLLLDQWKRALDGSKPDRAVVLKKTSTVLDANPWLE